MSCSDGVLCRVFDDVRCIDPGRPLVNALQYMREMEPTMPRNNQDSGAFGRRNSLSVSWSSSYMLILSFCLLDRVSLRRLGLTVHTSNNHHLTVLCLVERGAFQLIIIEKELK